MAGTAARAATQRSRSPRAFGYERILEGMKRRTVVKNGCLTVNESHLALGTARLTRAQLSVLARNGRLWSIR